MNFSSEKKFIFRSKQKITLSFVFLSVIAISLSLAPAEAGIPSTLTIIKQTTEGDDTFDFVVTGPTSYNPHIITGTVIFLNSTANDDFKNIYDDDGSSFGVSVGQSQTFSGQEITKVRFDHITIEPFLPSSNGTLQVRIYSDVTFDDTELQDATLVAESNIFQVNSAEITDEPLEFTLTSPTILTGEYAVTLVYLLPLNEEGIPEIIVPTRSADVISGECFVIQGNVPQSKFLLNSGPAGPLDHCVDLQLVIFQSNDGQGLGKSGPVLVEPGTYSIQETIPAGWDLTSAACTDGFSEFSVDTVSGIEIGPGENIECTFENEIIPLTLLTITKLAIGGEDKFDFVVTGPTSYNPSINTAGDLIGFSNLGTFGSTHDALYFEDDLLAPLQTTTGIIGQGVFQKGVDTDGIKGEIILGNDPSTWNFLHGPEIGEDVTSINFWIKGDVEAPEIEDSPVFPILGTKSGDEEEAGFAIYTQGGEATYISIREKSEDLLDLADIAPIPNDSNWHMITVIMDKGNETENWMVACFDGMCSNKGANFGFSFEPEDPTFNLTIGGGAGFGSVVTENGFNVDDLTIWNGYQLSQTDVNAMWNGGSGSTGGIIEPEFQVVHVSFDEGTEIIGEPGMIHGPTDVEPGTYSIQEIVPIGWILTSASCTDGLSGFSVDTVSGIEISSGDDIECTFVNEFAVSDPDSDSDGIQNEVDTLPNTFSNDFSDVSIGGTSFGNIITRGDQILTITEEANPLGVRIQADISGGLTPALVDACGEISKITITPGDNIVVTCSSVTIDVTSGPVEVTFISSGGVEATASIPTGNSITFNQDLFSFVAPSSNTVAISIDVDGTILTIDPGETNTSPPEVGLLILPVDPQQVNTLVDASATFTDLGPFETHTAQWDWGDTTTSAGSVTEDGLSGTVTGSHTYSTPGVYTVTLTVTDDNGDFGSSIFQFVVIYDPSGGFVTGGGWIDSPQGAYVLDSSFVGKATFGFVSKYQNGANIPTGNTQFSFKVADLKFKSTEYDWLVVAGSNAKFKGTGTINGQGNYGFQLFGFDADINTNDNKFDDKFRIKIWDKNNGDTVVYDNNIGEAEDSEPSTILGGGSIVIHNP